MRYQLELTLRRAEGALIRVLGTTERRGFTPLSVDGDTQPDTDHWRLRMTVEGDRTGDALQQQLVKLHDCIAVQVVEAGTSSEERGTSKTSHPPAPTRS